MQNERQSAHIINSYIQMLGVFGWPSKAITSAHRKVGGINIFKVISI